MDILRNVPKDERQRIIESVVNIDQNLHRSAAIKKDIEYLFEIWNEYVQPSNKRSITCRSHRMNVFSQYKYHVRQWKEWSEHAASL